MAGQRWLERLFDLNQLLGTEEAGGSSARILLLELSDILKADQGILYQFQPYSGKNYIERNVNSKFDWELSQQLEPGTGNAAEYVAKYGVSLQLQDEDGIDPTVILPLKQGTEKSCYYRPRGVILLPIMDSSRNTTGVIILMKTGNSSRGNPGFKKLSSVELKWLEKVMVQVVRCQTRTGWQKQLFLTLEGMVKTLIRAIERRNQSFAGHSEKMALYALKIAGAVSRASRGKWEQYNFSPIRRLGIYFAALAHDVGKLAIPDRILQKNRKLSKQKMQALRYLLAYLEETEIIDDMEEIYRVIEETNKLGQIKNNLKRRLEEIAEIEYALPDQEVKRLLSEDDLEQLIVAEGNLNSAEREIVANHPCETYRILKELPWPQELKDIPWIAALHHERLDGTGYPWGLKGDEIPLEARILAVADIYEALTASDRPYRDQISHEKAVEIVEKEAANGKIDGDIVRLFIDSGLWKEESNEDFLLEVMTAAIDGL